MESNTPAALPVITLGESESNHSRKSSSSSSTSSSSSGVVIGLEADDVIQVDTLEHKQDAPSDSDNIIDGFRDNSGLLHKPHSPDSPTQSPSTQVMDRPTGSPSSASYLIPSSVFARTKSTAPMEWSVTSNESLFSIQMGNMSFTRDQLNWVGKSGELNYYSDSNFPSPPKKVDMSSNQPPTPSKQSPQYKPVEIGQKNAGNETKSAETMRVVIKENEEDDRSKEKAPCNAPSLNHGSDENSGGSTKSFAFPILTNDKSKLRHATSGANSQPQTPKVANQTQKEVQPQAQQPETPKAENAGNKASLLQCKWMSCFPCCPSRS